jgi:hypothetical protein
MSDAATIAYGIAIVVWSAVEVALFVWVLHGVIRKLRKGGRANV